MSLVSTLWSCCENFIKKQHQEACQDSTYPPSPFLESWRIWRFLKNLEIVSYDMYQPSEVVVKISSNSNIRNPIKTLLVLQVPSWSLGGHGGSWQTWRWCQIHRSILKTFLHGFHHDQTSVRYLHNTFKNRHFIGKKGYRQTHEQ